MKKDAEKTSLKVREMYLQSLPDSDAIGVFFGYGLPISNPYSRWPRQKVIAEILKRDWLEPAPNIIKKEGYGLLAMNANGGVFIEVDKQKLAGFDERKKFFEAEQTVCKNCAFNGDSCGDKCPVRQTSNKMKVHEQQVLSRIYDEIKDYHDPNPGWVRIDLVRVLPGDKPDKEEKYTTRIGLVLKDSEAARFQSADRDSCNRAAEEIFRGRIREWMESEKGWRQRCKFPPFDWNWFFFNFGVDRDILAEMGVSKDVKDLSLCRDPVATAKVVVARNELLAPKDVPAVMVCTRSDGSSRNFDVAIDFADGKIDYPEDEFKEGRYTARFVVLKNGDKIPCVFVPKEYCKDGKQVFLEALLA